MVVSKCSLSEQLGGFEAPIDFSLSQLFVAQRVQVSSVRLQVEHKLADERVILATLLFKDTLMNSLRQQLSLLVICMICPGGVDLLERATQRSLRLFVRIFEEHHEVVVEELLW